MIGQFESAKSVSLLHHLDVMNTLNPHILLRDAQELLNPITIHCVYVSIVTWRQTFHPSHPSYDAITAKEEGLITKANSNKANKVYTVNDFTTSFTLTDSDFDDELDPPVFPSPQSKICLTELVQEYEKALKEFF